MYYTKLLNDNIFYLKKLVICNYQLKNKDFNKKVFYLAS